MPRYDIHFQGLPEDQVAGIKCFGFYYAAPLKVSGLQSLINRWVKTLMTPLGSDLLALDYGTNFSNLIGANVQKDTKLIKETVEMAVMEATEQVKSQDSDGRFEASEQLLGTEVLGYEHVDAGFSVWVRITNKTGDSAETAVATIGMSRY